MNDVQIDVPVAEQDHIGAMRKAPDAIDQFRSRPAYGARQLGEMEDFCLYRPDQPFSGPIIARLCMQIASYLPQLQKRVSTEADLPHGFGR